MKEHDKDAPLNQLATAAAARWLRVPDLLDTYRDIEPATLGMAEYMGLQLAVETRMQTDTDVGVSVASRASLERADQESSRIVADAWHQNELDLEVLPLLTRVAKVDTTSEVDLLALCIRIDGAAVWDGLEAHLRVPLLASVGEVCRLVQQILESLLEHGGMTWQQMQDLNRLFPFNAFGVKRSYKPSRDWEKQRRRRHPTFAPDYEGFLSEIEPEEVVPVAQMLEVVHARANIGTVIIDELCHLIRQMMAGEERLRRCDACHSVYVVSRAGRKYCSGRCRSRASVQRFRQRRRVAGK